MAEELTTFMCPLSINGDSLNLLDPKGPVQACIGTVSIFNFVNGQGNKLYYASTVLSKSCKETLLQCVR